MGKSSGKISGYIAVLVGFVVTLQAFQGSFKTFWPGKQVRISKSSKIFLAQIVPLEQELFAAVTGQGAAVLQEDQQRLLALLQLSRSWSRADNMQGADIDRFGQLLSWLHPNDLSSHGVNSVQAEIKTSPTLISSIAQILVGTLKQVHIGTAKIDLEYVGKFLQQLQSHGWNNTQRSKALQVFIIVQDIMKYFDGVSVTEYDFMVLSQCALFVQMLSFMN